MAAENGRKLFPEMLGMISPNQPADLVLFRWNGGLTIERTLLRGQEIFSISNSKSQISNSNFE
jgi:adenine deaminase